MMLYTHVRDELTFDELFACLGTIYNFTSVNHIPSPFRFNVANLINPHTLDHNSHTKFILDQFKDVGSISGIYFNL